jgi:hypothetical protein
MNGVFDELQGEIRIEHISNPDLFVSWRQREDCYEFDIAISEQSFNATEPVVEIDMSGVGAWQRITGRHLDVKSEWKARLGKCIVLNDDVVVTSLWLDKVYVLTPALCQELESLITTGMSIDAAIVLIRARVV